jgi:hypothetical protein
MSEILDYSSRESNATIVNNNKVQLNVLVNERESFATARKIPLYALHDSLSCYSYFVTPIISEVCLRHLHLRSHCSNHNQ